MTISPAVLQPGTTLSTSAASVITAAANTQAIVKRAVVSNPAAGAVTFTVYRVPVSGTPVASNEIIPARSIPAGGTDLCPELTNLVLNAGETVQALASTGSSLNFFASGFTN
ncbi:MAG TPA: hypothetical protein VHA37_10245 [Candidatus Saccharimonadales bacterium]|nr:hypothetical protein [Candidatus Saccharimonadales bacterium]